MEKVEKAISLEGILRPVFMLARIRGKDVLRPLEWCRECRIDCSGFRNRRYQLLVVLSNLGERKVVGVGVCHICGRLWFSESEAIPDRKGRMERYSEPRTGTHPSHLKPCKKKDGGYVSRLLGIR
jgi:hypothetical protein